MLVLGFERVVAEEKEVEEVSSTGRRWPCRREGKWSDEDGANCVLSSYMSR